LFLNQREKVMRATFFAALVLAGMTGVAPAQMIQPATTSMSPEMNQLLKAEVSKVIVRYEWRWDSGAAGGGYWLAEQGVVTGVSNTWLALRVDGSSKTHIIPFTAFKHLEIIGP
jgi:hypothetical protein